MKEGMGQTDQLYGEFWVGKLPIILVLKYIQEKSQLVEYRKKVNKDS
jgi:hypothetical protein